MSAYITTFYSFKGGVGRTLLLANVGVTLVKEYGHRVLLWDLDLEAPGMHHIPELRPEKLPKEGFMEWLQDWYIHQRMAPSPSEPSEKSLDLLFNRICSVPHLNNLYILPAYGERADFAGLYQSIPWNDFLINHPEVGMDLFRNLLKLLGKRGGYQHILLDARTGITDLGGLMAAVLPDVTVLVSNYSTQSMTGLINVYEALQPAVEGKLPERESQPPLHRLVVASPVPGGQKELHLLREQVWRKEFASELEETRVEIPFDDRLLFSEKLLALTEPDSEVSQAYRRVARKLENLRDEWLEQQDGSTREVLEEGAFVTQITRLLTLMGYQVKREPCPSDVNQSKLIARRKSGLRSECYIVECKKWNQPVSKVELGRFQTRLKDLQSDFPGAEGMYVAPAFDSSAVSYAHSEKLLTFTPDELEQQLFDFSIYLERLRRNFEESPLARTYIQQRIASHADPNQPDLLEHAKAWVHGEGKRLWILQGEFGTGKTTFCRRFAYELALKAQHGRMPAPIAVNLSEYPNPISLKFLLQDHLSKHAGWHGNPEILLYLLEAGRVVLLLDAFDEMGAATPTPDAEEQFRELTGPTVHEGERRASNRVLITCRSHFPLLEQLPRHPDLEPDIDELLPFNPEQIQEFLAKHLGEERTEEALRFIQLTYDLPSLVKYPVLLEMITNTLSVLMQEGDSFTAAQIYQLYTERWLQDRSGGLRTSANQRRVILERLADALWSRPQQRIAQPDFSSFLREILIKLAPDLEADRVEWELRTAPFLIFTADRHYAFTHKSFLEFFYACYLLSILKPASKKLEKVIDEIEKALAAAPLTVESIDFLADLMEDADRQRLTETIRSILIKRYRPQLSENALKLAYRYACSRVELQADLDRRPERIQQIMRDFIPRHAHLEYAELQNTWLPYAYLDGVSLRGARLQGAELSGASLKESDLAVAQMDGAKLRGTDFSKANFAGASLREVEAPRAIFIEAMFINTDLTAARMVQTRCMGASFEQACCYATRFAGADLQNVKNWDKVTTTVRLTAPYADANIDLPGRTLPANLTPFLQLGHVGSITAVDFSPDGGRLLTAGVDGYARLWDMETGEEIRYFFTGHEDRLNIAVFNADGEKVLTAGNDKSARLWDAKTGEEIRNTGTDQLTPIFTTHQDRISIAVFSPEGEQLLIAGISGNMYLWDLNSHRQLQVFEGHPVKVIAAWFSPDGQQLLSVGIDGNIYCWETSSRQKTGIIENSKVAIKAARFSSDGKQLLTANMDGSVRLWNVGDGQEIQRFRAPNSVAVALDTSKRRVITASEDGVARLWDTDSGAEIRVFQSRGNKITTAMFSADGLQVLTATEDGNVYCWDIESRRQIPQSEDNKVQFLFSQDEHRFITTNGNGIAQIWDKETDRLLTTLVSVAGGWLSLTADGHYQSDNNDVGLDCLSYYDPDEKALLPTLWKAIDIPGMRVSNS